MKTLTMAARRDDFRNPVRDLLARRVGYRCSNPNCRILTAGPGDGHDGTVNVGVAAHITAASAGGPRYDKLLSKEERQSADNGIWLCQVHAKQVDDAPERYTEELLRAWKRLSEESARLEIEELDKDLPLRRAGDIEAMKTYAAAFDRSAFKDAFSSEMSMTAFAQAIRDTVIALSTGILRDRDGKVIASTIGRSALDSRSWRERIGLVIDMLNAIARRFELAVDSGAITIHGRGREIETYCVHDHSLLAWMDQTRAEALDILSGILAEAGLDPIRHERFRRHPF
jgi:hypothetical protein